jgi:hypothetical protein
VGLQCPTRKSAVCGKERRVSKSWGLTPSSQLCGFDTLGLWRQDPVSLAWSRARWEVSSDVGLIYSPSGAIHTLELEPKGTAGAPAGTWLPSLGDTAINPTENHTGVKGKGKQSIFSPLSNEPRWNSWLERFIYFAGLSVIYWWHLLPWGSRQHQAHLCAGEAPAWNLVLRSGDQVSLSLQNTLSSSLVKFR